MSDNEAKALELVAEAEKKLNSSKSFFGGLFGRQNKQGEALRCYERAANLFKMAKKWSQAGKTFVTLAQHHTKLGNKHESATNYVNASNCYKESDPMSEFYVLILCKSMENIFRYLHAMRELIANEPPILLFIDDSFSLLLNQPQD